MANYFKTAAVSSLLLTATSNAAVLAPANDILFPSSKTAQSPLQYSGGNSPYFAGPNVNGVSNETPEKCTVQQAAYVVRHGSRFPDTGSYNSWVALQEKIQIAVNGTGFNARGSLSFIEDWSPVLTNPTLQIAQESMTGWKEASDLGYQLRARYPDFYEDGSPFYVWANQYKNPINESRVVQTARAFVNGYLYEFADTYGTVISVNSTGSVNAIGNSLGPSDSCPTFASTSSGGNNVTDFDDTWVPRALKRINSLVKGNLTFDETDILFFPYLCGYESQITGNLSPWCGVFTEDELRNYAYSQDLSYYYGVGPGADGPAPVLFLPFLESLTELLSKGPSQTGVDADGNPFTVPNLIMAFLNDNQIAEMTAAMGIFDEEAPLSSTRLPKNHLYNIAHWITMRGTVAFEVLNCSTGNKHGSSTEPYIRVLFNDAVYPIASCHDGPGKSCLLSKYVSLLKKKSQKAGSFIEYCNVTGSNHPETVGGASFFTDLSLDFLTFVKP
ncbi:phosphoglycerate mutase-like protein [Penicillium waksmanii]|uniref:phosphoglycerate mutase-like protein n=1 Tax=Penicillium waksmanii TaxID=69791 RepID=UPI002547234B|nr:phosphoglycerate mutase-like protein [Penicillium waksmanii]KAJ5983413.1 phosphoglycerate mutase-like protein [Penicillium waksmanii]